MQAVGVVVGVLTLTTAVAVGGLLAFFEWENYQFKNGSYCQAEPNDPFC
jgi:hypothetical protein